MNHIVKKAVLLVLFLTSLFVITSCLTAPKEVALDLTAKEINQKAQEYSSSGNYAAAELYYKTLIQRFGMDTSILVPAEFELAHIYIKQKKYDKAKPMLERILAYYEVQSNNLPREYKKLAQIDLDKIPQE